MGDRGNRMIFKLRAIRESKGLSQQELAAKAGLSISTVQKYEYASKPQYSHKILESLCTALDCDPSELFSWEVEAA